MSLYCRNLCGLFYFLLGSLCYCQDVHQRFDSYLLEKSVVDQGFSVLIEKSEIGDTLDDSGQASLEAGRVYQRLVISDGGRSQRMDGKCLNLLSEKSIVNRSTESQLVLQDTGKMLLYSKDRLGTKVLSHQLKGGVVPVTTMTRRKHPFDMAVTNCSGFAKEFQTGIVYSTPKLLHEVVLKDGRTKMTLLSGQNGAWDVTFQKDPEWCPQEIVFYARGGRPIPKSGITSESLKDWNKYTTTRCTWTHVANEDFWVPSTIHLETDEDGEERELEVRFLDWKFGPEAVASLMDPASFTPEKIAESIDFSKVREKFEKNTRH